MYTSTRSVRRIWILPLAVAAALPALGCGAVRGRRGTPQESGFLRDYSQLKPREGYEAQLVYVKPGVDWSRYNAVQIDSVTLWVTRKTEKLSPDERQMLTDLLYKALHEKLGAEFRLSDRPGADVLRLRAALTQVKGANVPLRTISTVVPQLMLISTAVGLSADVAKTVGTATVEAELLDSVTGERLAAAVDQRAGTKSLFTTRTFSTWGDVEAAANYWSERVAQFLVKQGVRRKPGAER
jgi:hypothetical protein